MFDEENEKRQITYAWFPSYLFPPLLLTLTARMQSFSTEAQYEICDLLPADDLFHAFIDLNDRFPRVVGLDTLQLDFLGLYRPKGREGEGGCLCFSHNLPLHPHPQDVKNGRDEKKPSTTARLIIIYIIQ